MINPASPKPIAKKRHIHKTTYIGVSRKETDFLLSLSSEDVKTYIAFKWLADFSTGFVGTDPKRYMTLERLAEAARTSTAKLVQQITNLQEVGLICELQKVDHVHISFRLTLSPEIEDREVKPGELLNSGNSSIALGVEDCREAQPSANPTILPKVKQPPCPSFDEDDREVESWADEYEDLAKACPQYSSTSELSLSSTDSTDGENPPIPTQLEAQFLGGLQAHGGSTPTEPPNPVEEIKLILKSHGFLWVHTPMSRSLYKQWISLATLEEIEIAASVIAELHDTERTPLALDKHLRALKKPKSSGRGKVAL